MAKLAALIDGTANALQVNPSRVRTAAAHLRKHRLLTTGPRGPGAPEMTPIDATNLLLAVMYDGELAEAHETVPRLREARLVRFQRMPFDPNAKEHAFASNSFLRTDEGEVGHLGDVLDTMLDWWVRYGTISEGQAEGEDLEPMNLDLEISCPGYRATLIFSDPCCVPWQFDYEWKSPEQLEYEASKHTFAPRWDARNGPHIWSSRSVGEDCLREIATCLRGSEWRDWREEITPVYDRASACLESAPA